MKNNIFSNKKRIQVVMLGSTGVGKSTLGNKLTQRNIFRIGDTLYSETLNSQEATFTVEEGFECALIDAQGFLDNRDPSKEISLYPLIHLMNELKKGIHLILYCVAAKDRFDEIELSNLRQLRILLGEQVYDHTCIVITQIDKLDNCPEDKERILYNYKNKLSNFLKGHDINISQDSVLVADYDNFKGFTEAFKLKSTNSKMLLPEICELDVAKPLKALQNPIFKNYLHKGEQSLQAKSHKMKAYCGENNEEIRKIEARLLLVQILKGSFTDKWSIYCSYLEDSKLESLSILAKYFKAETLNQSPSLMDDIYQEIQEYSKKENGDDRKVDILADNIQNRVKSSLHEIVNQEIYPKAEQSLFNQKIDLQEIKKYFDQFESELRGEKDTLMSKIFGTSKNPHGKITEDCYHFFKEKNYYGEFILECLFHYLEDFDKCCLPIPRKIESSGHYKGIIKRFFIFICCSIGCYLIIKLIFVI